MLLPSEGIAKLSQSVGILFDFCSTRVDKWGISMDRR